MPIDEMHIAANRFVEEFQNAITRMLARHRGEGVGEVLDEGEDHGLRFRSVPTDQWTFVCPGTLSSDSALC